MVNYNQAKIYKIWSPSTGMTYIGSTCNALSKRISQHRDNKKRYEAGKYNYVTSFKVLDHPDIRIDLIEYFPCNNKTELNRREGEIIVQTDCVNKFVAGQTQKEYDQKNKEKKKEYRQKNKEAIAEKHKEYRQKNKEKIREHNSQQHECTCGKIYTLNSKARHERSKKHIEFIENLECED